ncbi:MAG TPA: hypothetical protein DCR97_11980 [Deltaproteobacteria bacterium]|nr:hypothetical protein [Deltaproteobacteria bacterium]
MDGIFLARFAGEMLPYTRCFYQCEYFACYFKYFHEELQRGFPEVSVKVHIYDRKTKRGTLEFYLAAFVDEKVVALKHVDLSSMPDLKMEDVNEELQKFVQMFREEISEGLVAEVARNQASPESEGRKNLKK